MTNLVQIHTGYPIIKGMSAQDMIVKYSRYKDGWIQMSETKNSLFILDITESHAGFSSEIHAGIININKELFILKDRIEYNKFLNFIVDECNRITPIELESFVKSQIESKI